MDQLKPIRRPDTSWHNQAACRPLHPSDLEMADLFFGPEKEGPVAKAQRERLAKQVCRRCVVIDRCLAYALDADEKFGVWGGQSEEELRRLRRRRLLGRVEKAS